MNDLWPAVVFIAGAICLIVSIGLLLDQRFALLALSLILIVLAIIIGRNP